MAKRPQKSEVPPVSEGHASNEYKVTDKAPGRVAGRQVKPEQVITLTEEQARAELLAGHIRPAGITVRGSNETSSTVV